MLGMPQGVKTKEQCFHNHMLDVSFFKFLYCINEQLFYDVLT